MLKIVEFLKKYWKQLLLVSLGAFIMLKAQGCYHHFFPPKPPVAANPLPPDVKERVSVKNGVVKIETHDGTNTISGVREGTLVIKNDGTTSLQVRDHGWEHQIGFNGYVGSDGGALGFDLRPYYYKKMDAMIGLGYMPRSQKLDLWFGLGYTPATTWFSNTTVFVGYSVNKNPVAGVSVRF